MTTETLPFRHIQFTTVNMACRQNLPSLLTAWLPDGRRVGDEWTARNPTRADRRPGSFKINIQTGRWADFATGDKGGDPVSLYAYLNGLSQGQAARELIETWGMDG
ncbi:hypothetical protein SAMN04488020_12011 [Palleronia marisminoris]|uniref:DNA primase n=1 Tax=Palleronia marisminoris TaxID=315423 RepID=A0A1Y5TWG8_9RHOB|nr:hypothetical protein [Palleronia marisminoris]SFH52556.1 hypothetical protein SAMN04488020_12011 [Palleronia marisminoris]SLN71597.1 hypothetical protein PAM7066_03671 [Palleronia marisminoris]